MNVNVEKSQTTRPTAFWIAIGFMSVSLVLLPLGQTMALFDYEFAVSLGMQEDVSEIGLFGVALNRAFGVSDTFVYVPLMVVSIIGLGLKKNWALLTSACVMGISIYWSLTAAAAFWFLMGVPGYNFVPGPGYLVFIASYFLFGVWGVWYLMVRGARLIS